eukprot:353590-Chlamydomonas_euryale.AAC.6
MRLPRAPAPAPASHLWLLRPAVCERGLCMGSRKCDRTRRVSRLVGCHLPRRTCSGSVNRRGHGEKLRRHRGKEARGACALRSVLAGVLRRRWLCLAVVASALGGTHPECCKSFESWRVRKAGKLVPGTELDDMPPAKAKDAACSLEAEQLAAVRTALLAAVARGRARPAHPAVRSASKAVGAQRLLTACLLPLLLCCAAAAAAAAAGTWS